MSVPTGLDWCDPDFNLRSIYPVVSFEVKRNPNYRMLIRPQRVMARTLNRSKAPARSQQSTQLSIYKKESLWKSHLIEHQTKVNSISFSFDGEKCLAASDDDSISIYLMRDGTLKKKVFSKKYGVTNVQFTQNANRCVYGYVMIFQRKAWTYFV